MTSDSIDSVVDLDCLETDGPQIVTFTLDGERFALPMESVQEIVRVPLTVRVPLSSSHLMGLANLRGRVLPVFECRTMMGILSEPITESSRVLVLRMENPIGLMVDRVHAVVTISSEQIESIDQNEELSNSEWLAGVVRQESQLTLLLDVERLIASHAALGKASGTFRSSAPIYTEGTTEDEQTPDELQLVSFDVANQEYAAPIHRVQEIVQAPTEYTTLPHAPPEVLGVMVLRSKLLPLLSLRMLFGLETLPLEEHHRVVVLQLRPGVSVGVVMDKVNEVLRVAKSVQEAVPPLFNQRQSINHIQSMCRLENGKRLVSIIDIDSLHSFTHKAVEQIRQGTSDEAHSMSSSESMQEINEMEDEGQVVVFKLGDEEFGVDIHSVQEIVRVPEQLTRIPQTPDFLEGVINLRGSVLPVIDQRRRMGICPGDRQDRQRIMVYLMNGVRTGFIVDSVTEVLRLDPKDISDTPSGGLHDVGLLPKVANLTDSKRMILLIDPLALLSNNECRMLEMSERYSSEYGRQVNQRSQDGLGGEDCSASLIDEETVSN